MELDISKYTGITNDSREVKPGFIFVAYQGVNEDLHQYITSARERGASLIVGEKGLVDHRVEDGRVALAKLASLFYGNPAKDLTLIGVTGTNGKTSVAKMISSILEAGYIGTIGYQYRDIKHTAKETTPDPVTLHRVLREFVDGGAKTVVIETTSQGLAQQRLYGLGFKVAVFTNLTQDHLDYHQNMDQYLQAKLKLFDQAEVAVLNQDESTSQKIADRFSGQVVFYGRYEGSLAMKGIFNQYNAGAAQAVARLFKVEQDVVKQRLSQVTVPGRFEMISKRVIVDYAHTPDALERVLENARFLVGEGGRLVTVFGCGGDRDQTKRPKMGRIAERLSDWVIVTSDNPRTESPYKIIAGIVGGMREKDYQIISDRSKAIETAIKGSKKPDIIVIAGKGHENYQIIGRDKIHFDDREEARKVLDEI